MNDLSLKHAGDWTPKQRESVLKLLKKYKHPCYRRTGCCCGNIGYSACYGWGCMHNEDFVWFVTHFKNELPVKIRRELFGTEVES